MEGGKIPVSQGVIRGSGYALPPRLSTHWDIGDIKQEKRTERIGNYNKLSNSEE